MNTKKNFPQQKIDLSPQHTSSLFNELSQNVRELWGDLGVQNSEKAFNFVKTHQGNQKRASEEPYINHLLRTAIEVAQMKIDINTVIASLLHDVIEDTPITIKNIETQFGKEIAFLVSGATKIDKIKYQGIERDKENIKKMILAIAQDLRVLFIKLADRLDNLKDIQYLREDKQKRIALETLEIYAPLAFRLGMNKIGGMLEDLSFPIIYPNEYQWILNEIKDKYEDRTKYLETLTPIMEKSLKDHGVIDFQIEFRAKRYYSLYQKLLKYDMNLDRIYDLVALRIIVPKIEQCYLALGIIHQIWKPLPGGFDDYIALPKQNGYQGIHTTVFADKGKIVEVQIRTQEMHERAEKGIAAYWAYSEAKRTIAYRNNKPITLPKQLMWVAQLQKWQEEFWGSKDFFESLKIDFFKDRIFVLTPKGDVIDLPEGATPVDFAYQIHSQIGNQCAGVKINGKIGSLDEQLKTRDVVEILTQKNKKPSEGWLNFAKTSFAQEKIRTALKKRTLLPAIKRKKVIFKIAVKDRIGLLKDLSEVFYSTKINIDSSRTSEEGKYHYLIIKCSMKDLKKIKGLILKIKQVKDVLEVGYKEIN